MTTSTRAGGEAPDVAAPLDLLLTDAAIGIARRFRPAWSLATVGRQLAARPGLAAGQGVALARQLGAVITGRSDLVPEPRDRRFADPAWTQNPLLRRAVQGYVATATAADHVVDELAWKVRRASVCALPCPTSSTRPRRATTRCSTRPR